jgi:crotonobetainyl-CoA:carnitine CoA-transferase CaiB-like acyl-CoA transferase
MFNRKQESIIKFMQALQGIKVVELASVLAGPAVGTFLAELGADVLKIENPKTGGDVTRSWKLATEDPNNPGSAYYASVNWGKKVIMEDLTQPEARERILHAIAEADIVLTNFKDDFAKKYRYTASDFHAVNSRVIIGEITGWSDNPARVAYDLVLQAETGFMSMNGTQESGPLKMPVALIDILAAHQLKEGVLVALLQRSRTGRGAHVKVSLYDAAIASLANQATNWIMAGHLPKPIGSLHPNIAPYGEIVFSSDQAPLVLAIGSDRQFQELCNMLECAAIAHEERFATNKARVANRRVLLEELQARFIQYDYNYIEQQAERLQIPIGKICNIKEVFEKERAQSLLLTDKDGSKRVRNAVFEIEVF